MVGTTATPTVRAPTIRNGRPRAGLSQGVDNSDPRSPLSSNLSAEVADVSNLLLAQYAAREAYRSFWFVYM